MTVPERILVIGLGGVARCALPLLFEHLPVEPSGYTVIDFDQVNPADVRALQERGARFAVERVTPENYREVLGRHVSGGDMIIDLAWNIDTGEVIDWCRANGVRYINASVEVWDPYSAVGIEPPRERTLYARHMKLRQMINGWGENDGPTAVLDHGANPGLVSHLVKRGLLDIATHYLEERAASFGIDRESVFEAAGERNYAMLAKLLEVKTIHISERDTQVSREPKRENEFVNTWSVEGFYEEGIAPAELGWGTHEKRLPPGAQTHRSGPLNQICISHPGCRTWVRSWVPCGEIVGMVIRHGEAFSISDRLTVYENGEPVYRPTVHYAYCPSDAALASLHELHMRGDRLQERHRLMYDDIVEGRDELGCLLLGHPFNGWWIGSLLDIEEARRLAPGHNATTLQVAAAVLGAAKWTVENPRAGVRLPDDLPHEEILEVAKPYLGPLVSQPVDWTPLYNWSDGFHGYGRPRPDEEDVWQFTTFLVTGPMGL